jgi:hypothetical protein
MSRFQRHFQPKGPLAGLLTIDEGGGIMLELDGYFANFWSAVAISLMLDMAFSI